LRKVKKKLGKWASLNFDLYCHDQENQTGPLRKVVKETKREALAGSRDAGAKGHQFARQGVLSFRRQAIWLADRHGEMA